MERSKWERAKREEGDDKEDKEIVDGCYCIGGILTCNHQVLVVHHAFLVHLFPLSTAPSTSTKEICDKTRRHCLKNGTKKGQGM
jgi:hypothetical protein